jgi:hypothetical protein
MRLHPLRRFVPPGEVSGKEMQGSRFYVRGAWENLEL